MKEKESWDQLHYENRLWDEGYQQIMGLDEVGRGCLAGPVVAAGVILRREDIPLGITDSKQIKTHTQRVEIAKLIKEKALYWVVKSCEPSEIDQLNILRASLFAMKKCVESNEAQPDFLLIDGNKTIDSLIRQKTIIKGDSKSASIGAASILAKVYRDELMFQLHELYPFYSWDKNVGYPTIAHYNGLSTHGITPLHRRSFNLKTTLEYISDEAEGSLG